MPVTALYRKRSGEVLKISLKGQDFLALGIDTVRFGQLTDPLLPDGTQVREELPDGTLGPLRQLGFAKIADPATNTVRNATQAEIDGFQAAEDADEADQDAEAARTLTKTNPVLRKAFVALVKMINQTRQDAGLPPWTLAQIANFFDTLITPQD